jgi:hypothetical protein
LDEYGRDYDDFDGMEDLEDEKLLGEATLAKLRVTEAEEDADASDDDDFEDVDIDEDDEETE